MKTRKIAYLGVFLALALILSYVESLIPFYFGIPGVKLGLTNLIVVVMLYCTGTKEAFGVSVARILLAGFLFGNLFSILYSLAGGVLSFIVMCLLKKTGRFHVMTTLFGRHTIVSSSLSIALWCTHNRSGQSASVISAFPSFIVSVFVTLPFCRIKTS